MIPSPIRLRFGGLLVIQLANFRRRISIRGLHGRLELNERFTSTIKDIVSAGPGKKNGRLFIQADRLLSELLKLASLTIDDEAERVLLPVFLNRSRVNWNDDGRISSFLELLCDKDTGPYLSTRRAFHDLRNTISNAGGWLLSLAGSSASRHVLSDIRFAEIAKGLLSRCDDIAEHLHRVARELQPADTMIFRTYYRTEEHREAVRILLEKLGEIAEREPKEKWLSDELVDYSRQFDGEPHVTPLMELLSRTSYGRTSIELVSEPAVLSMLSLISNSTSSKT